MPLKRNLKAIIIENLRSLRTESNSPNMMCYQYEVPQEDYNYDSKLTTSTTEEDKNRRRTLKSSIDYTLPGCCFGSWKC